MTRPARRAAAALFAGLAALSAAVFGDVLLSGGARTPSPWQLDMGAAFLAWRTFLGRELRDGRLPLWNPHQMSGTPFLGAFESGALYPPNWLHAVLPAPVAIDWLIALHVFLAGAFAAGWALRRRASAWGALAAALPFMLGAPMLLRVYAGHLAIVLAAPWAAAVLACVDGWLETGRAPWLACGAAAAALQALAGAPQISYYTALGAAAYALPSAARRPGRGSWLLLLAAGGAVLGAAQLLPGWGVVAQSIRAGGLPAGMAGTFSTPVRFLPTMISVLTPLDANYFWESVCFVGLVATVCAVCALTAAERPRAALAALGAAGLALAVLPGTALAPLLSWLPGAAMLRGSSKAFFLVSLAVGQLAADGVDALERRRRGLGRALSLLVLVELLAFAARARASSEPLVPALDPGVVARAGDDRILSDMRYFPNAATSAQAFDAWGYGSLPLARYARFMALTQGLSPERPGQYLVFERDSPLLDLPRVRFLVDHDGTRERRAPLPRAALYERWRTASSTAAVWGLLAEKSFDPRREVVLESEPRPAPEPGGARGRAAVSAWHPGFLELEVDLPKPAVLLVTDAYARGWRAQAEPPVPLSVEPADGAFQSVALPAGRRRVRLTYWPAEVSWGLALSGLGWAALLAAAVFYGKKARWR